MIRRLIRNNAFLYPLYVKFLLRNKHAKFPTPLTHLHLTGFPRSANTYCGALVAAAFPDLNVASHVHTTASIKMALRYNVTTLVLARDPVSACCSLLLLRQEPVSTKVIGRLFREYIDYYQYVMANRKRLFILRFEDVVGSPEYLIHIIADLLSLELENVEIPQRIKMPAGGKSLPNEARQQMTAEFESHFFAHSLCAHAMQLYDEIQILRCVQPVHEN